MIEKSIILDGIPLVDFFGVENRNINKLSSVFPKSRIISRGNEIIIQGSEEDIAHITRVLDALVSHFHRFGEINEDHIRRYHGVAQGAVDDVDGLEALHVREEPLLYGSRGAPIRVKTPSQQRLVEAVEHNDLVFALGAAGTGKTYLAIALAMRALKMRSVGRIVITRPVVEAGEHLGFLPGDMKAKIDPYLRPVYDAFRDMLATEKMEYYLEREIIEIAPLAYMRGRTLQNAFVVLDEAQNTTPMQMKMALTRMGIGSKMVVTGDPSQTDLANGQRSGLEDAMEALTGVERIAFVALEERDVVRHRLVRAIVEAYQRKRKS